jgi:hypothetical protein
MRPSKLVIGSVALMAIAIAACGSSSSVCEYFDPVMGLVAETGALVEPRRCHSTTLMPDGRVLLGGLLVQRSEPGAQEDPPPVFLTSAELFTP